MSIRKIELYLEDIYEAIAKIERYTNGVSFANFCSDEKTIDSVVRNLESLARPSIIFLKNSIKDILIFHGGKLLA